MSISVVLFLLLIGLILIILEILVFPGVGIAGIAGLIFLVVANYLAYSNFDTTTGNIILAVSLLITAGLLYFALRPKTWDKASLDTQINSKVEKITDEVKPGTTGITLSRLAPMGKVIIDGKTYEAECKNMFLDEDTEIVVVKIEPNKIIVKPKK